MLQTFKFNLNKSYLRFLKSAQKSEGFSFQNVIKTKFEFLSEKVISTINGKKNSKKNIYILREKSRTRQIFKSNSKRVTSTLG